MAPLPANAGADLPLAAADLRPYLAPLLLARAVRSSPAGFLADLAAEVSGAIVSSDGVERSAPEESVTPVVGGLSAKTLQYVEASTPPWAPRDALQDIAHHLVVVAVSGDHAAVCTSDPGLRNKLTRLLTTARPLPRALIERAFVGDRASVMWLNGIHNPVDSKPNAKTLSGSALEYALDPLGDQTFYYSAVRSRVALAGGEALVGAAPGGGRIWLNRPKTWDDFLRDLGVLFDTIARPPAASVKFAALAQAVADLSGVERAYAVTLMAPELLADQDLTEAERELTARWTEEAKFDVHVQPDASFAASVRVSGQDLGRVVVTVDLEGDDVVARPVWDAAPPGDPGLRAEGARLLADPKWLKVYYETGHAISQGRCYASAYRDLPFEWSFKDFGGYSITEEKPTPHSGLKLPDVIAAAKADGTMDDSLFAYVVANWGADGWLACDDKSMEMADFIHIAHDNTVTLIHAKASGSADPARDVSVSSYEVVVGQAIKNLRHLQSKTLVEELKRGRKNQIAAAVWCDGARIAKQVGTVPRDGMIARARFLPANYKRVVVVLQPQLTQSERDDCLKPTTSYARSVRMKQLDTLMLSARLSCMAVGAEFVGMAAS